MNTELQLNHQHPQEHFSAFIKVLAEKFKPLYIYCFGKIFESSSKEGCFIDSAAEQHCRYYLLMILENETRIEHHVQDYVNEHFRHGMITILVHGKDAVREEINANNRFFITVSNFGELLYCSDRMLKSFQVPGYVPTRAAAKASKHFSHHLTLASGFQESAKECLRTSKYHLCIFMLHQVVEQCCIALIGVHISYKADIHNLRRLLHLCDIFSPELSRVFLNEAEEGRRLFELILRSYSAARYRDDFIVTQSDAETLYSQVSAFLEMTEVLCVDKIAGLEVEAEDYKKLRIGASNL